MIVGTSFEPSKRSSCNILTTLSLSTFCDTIYTTLAIESGYTMNSYTTPFVPDNSAMVAIRDTPRTTLDARTSAQIEVIWQMARESLAANDNQILINSSVYQTIGNSGLEELKVRLR